MIILKTLLSMVKQLVIATFMCVIICLGFYAMFKFTIIVCAILTVLCLVSWFFSEYEKQSENENVKQHRAKYFKE